MNKEDFKSGVILSPEDPRDFTVDMACKALGTIKAQTFTDEFNITYPDEVLNQGNIGACVAYSLSEERCATEYRQTGKVNRFSQGYIYGDRFSFYKGEGMITRDALDALRKYGAVIYDEFPYIDTYDKLFPLIWGDRGSNVDKLRQKANPYRISSYFRLDVEGEDLETNIKNALLNGMVVITCFDVYDSFFNIGSDGIVPIPDKTKEKNYGGHATTTFGWQKINGISRTNTLNSWGKEKGDNGWYHFPFNYPFKEVWALSDNIDANLVKLQQKFVDADTIATWAREYVVKANELGLMSGDGNVFNPKGTLSREQLAIVAVKIFEALKGE